MDKQDVLTKCDESEKSDDMTAQKWNSKTYSGGCVCGLLKVDEVKGVSEFFRITNRHSEPWIRELKLITDDWTDCAVYYSYDGAVFNNVKVAENKVYLPHVYLWGIKKSQSVTSGAKIEVLSPAEMAKAMETATESKDGRKRLSFEGRGTTSKELLTFAQKYDEQDPDKTLKERTDVVAAIQAALKNALV